MIRVTTDLACDRCGCWEHGISSHRVETRWVRAELRKRGWRTRRRDGRVEDLCPKCVERTQLYPMED